MFYSHEGANRAVIAFNRGELFLAYLRFQFSSHIAQVRSGNSVVCFLYTRQKAVKDER